MPARVLASAERFAAEASIRRAGCEGIQPERFCWHVLPREIYPPSLDETVWAAYNKASSKVAVNGRVSGNRFLHQRGAVIGWKPPEGAFRPSAPGSRPAESIQGQGRAGSAPLSRFERGGSYVLPKQSGTARRVSEGRDAAFFLSRGRPFAGPWAKSDGLLCDMVRRFFDMPNCRPGRRS